MCACSTNLVLVTMNSSNRHLTSSIIYCLYQQKRDRSKLSGQHRSGGNAVLVWTSPNPFFHVCVPYTLKQVFLVSSIAIINVLSKKDEPHYKSRDTGNCLLNLKYSIVSTILQSMVFVLKDGCWSSQSRTHKPGVDLHCFWGPPFGCKSFPFRTLRWPFKRRNSPCRS